MRKSYPASTEDAVNHIKVCLIEDGGCELTPTLLRVYTVLGFVTVNLNHINNRVEVVIVDKPHQISDRAFFNDITERIKNCR